jgi:hypothetical protein
MFMMVLEIERHLANVRDVMMEGQLASTLWRKVVSIWLRMAGVRLELHVG